VISSMDQRWNDWSTALGPYTFSEFLVSTRSVRNGLPKPGTTTPTPD
jgi:hypothetical protein